MIDTNFLFIVTLIFPIKEFVNETGCRETPVRSEFPIFRAISPVANQRAVPNTVGDTDNTSITSYITRNENNVSLILLLYE